MIVVTGGAGFVGSNLIWELNRAGRSDVLVVDNLTDARKFKNLVGADIADYIDKQDFLSMVASRSSDLDEIELISHQGACTSTTESDGRYMMKNNYEYSKALLDLSLERQLPMIYASSAAVYGGGTSFGISSMSACLPAEEVPTVPRECAPAPRMSARVAAACSVVGDV